MDSKELWKDIDGYEGLYQVSNLGRIKSLERIIPHINTTRVIREKILKQSVDKYGYLSVSLYLNGARKTIKVHRLVALAFITNLDNLPEVNHKDGIKSHNFVDNLEWSTRGYNISHAIKMGLNTTPDLRKKVIRTQDSKVYNSLKEVCEELNVSRATVIQSIKKGYKCRGYNFKYYQKE